MAVKARQLSIACRNRHFGLDAAGLERQTNRRKTANTCTAGDSVFRHFLMMSGRRKVAYTSSRVSTMLNVDETHEARMRQKNSAAAQPRETSYPNTP
jgi:hypothetical protein